MTEPKLPTGWWLWSVRASEIRRVTRAPRGWWETLWRRTIDVARPSLLRSVNRFAKPVLSSNDTHPATRDPSGRPGGPWQGGEVRSRRGPTRGGAVWSRSPDG